MFHWFSPSSVEDGCSLNITLITLALLLCLVFALASLHPSAAKVRWIVFDRVINGPGAPSGPVCWGGCRAAGGLVCAGLTAPIAAKVRWIAVQSVIIGHEAGLVWSVWHV